MKFVVGSKTLELNKLSKTFLLSALFFAFFSFFGVYRYTIYSMGWFLYFFILEFSFFLGLQSRKVNKALSKAQERDVQFIVPKQGALILGVMMGLSWLCFAYFLFLYRSRLGSFVFGNYTANAFAEEGRTALEKITLLLMQLGGDAGFLILAADKTDRWKKLKNLSIITFFLPGLRYLLMGARFCIAAEFLMLFSIKWPQIQQRLKYSAKARWQKRVIVTFAIILGVAFCYLFASRSIYYTALERKAFIPGDMIMKPVWKKLYDMTNGGTDFICTLSDYLGEAPFIFAYYCKNFLPEKIYWGQFTFRGVMQIVNSLTGLGNSFGQISSEIAGGQYSGFGYTLIADFGVVGSLPAAFLIGRFFATIEKRQYTHAFAHVLFAPVQIICFFAPIFFFYVGRMDYTIMACIVFARFCLKTRRGYVEDVHGDTSKES